MAKINKAVLNKLCVILYEKEPSEEDLDDINAILHHSIARILRLEFDLKRMTKTAYPDSE